MASEMATELENAVGEIDPHLRAVIFDWPIVSFVRTQADAFIQSDLMATLATLVEQWLTMFGVQPPYPEAEHIAVSIFATAGTLIGYWAIFGARHRRKRHELAKMLTDAAEHVKDLEEKLAAAEAEEAEERRDGPVRIWMDGAFDMMHYGHMNAFRQGKSLGTHLVVGVNSDESIRACKGPPVMNDDERITSVEACKFVDEVVPGAPYVMNEDYLNEVVFGQYKCDYVVHGDDPCIVDGKDVFESSKKMGKYKSVPRTEGVSTTDIVGRMLLMSKEHHQHKQMGEEGTDTSELASQSEKGTCRSKFLTTSRIIRLFSAGVREPPANARVVYMDGAWDMFHAGHIKSLKAAREFGDYLIVGVHNDDIVNKHRGANMPIMNLHERVLSVLGCKYVDDVLIDAPWDISEDMIASLKITTVAHGTQDDDTYLASDEEDEDEAGGSGAGAPPSSPGTPRRSRRSSAQKNNYIVPREMGIFREFTSTSDMSVLRIVDRIHDQQEYFAKKFAKKKKAEDEYYAKRYAAEEGKSSARK